jgi:uncharacterized protein (TIGR03437 family)
VHLQAAGLVTNLAPSICYATEVSESIKRQRRSFGAFMPNCRLAAATVTLALGQLCFGQFGGPPYVSAVVNSASYSGASIPQGAIVTIFGANLGPDTLVRAHSYPLPEQLGGTSVNIDVGAQKFSCPMIYASSYQVAVIVPSNVPVGSVTLTVTYFELTSFGTSITVSSSAFGIYSTSSSGIGPGVITGADYVSKSFKHPARPGEVLILWGTGLGPVQGGDSTPEPGKNFPNVEVFVGSSAARVSYAGRSGCCAGLDQIAFKVPDSTLGCFVPVAVRTGGVIVSNFVTVPISTGQSCSDPPASVPAPILAKALAGQQLKFGAIAIGPVRVLQGAGFSFSQGMAESLSRLLHRPVDEADVRHLVRAYAGRKSAEVRRILAKYGLTDKRVDRRLVQAVRAAATGLDQQAVAAAFGTFRSLSDLTSLFASNFTSVGTCTVTGLQLATSDARSRSADAGASLMLDGPLGSRVVPEISNGQYQVTLGSGFANGTVPPGLYTVSGNGGADVGPFTASLNVGGLIWTNMSAIASIDRTRPLTVTWAGGSGYVLIGASVHTTGTNKAFLCVQDATKGSFTVPSFVLSALPAAEAGAAYLFVAPHPFSNPVSIPGIDLAYIADGSSNYKAVDVR